MMFHFFRRGLSKRNIAALYGMIVAQARAAPFYRNCGVPDTVNGRFEMVVLHMVLVLRRLGSETHAPGEAQGARARRVGQALFDWFCRDMDGSLREMGVGDLAVPKKMRKIGEAFYGRQAAYAAALGAMDATELTVALQRNVFGEEPGSAPHAIALAAYTRAAADRLAGQDFDAICRAELTFPDPVPAASGSAHG